jgi:hypothetical protein
MTLAFISIERINLPFKICVSMESSRDFARFLPLGLATILFSTRWNRTQSILGDDAAVDAADDDE